MAKEGVFEAPITMLCVVWIKERGSKREARNAIMTFDANDLVCGECGCLTAPDLSNTDDKAH